MPGPARCAAPQLAKKILEERFRIVGLKAEEIRIDFLGLNAIHGAATPAERPPSPTRSRCGSRREPRTREEAIKVGREVDGMAVSGHRPHRQARAARRSARAR